MKVSDLLSHLEYNGMYCTKIENTLPKPSGKYAGIGSRVLPENGVKAIENLYL